MPPNVTAFILKKQLLQCCNCQQISLTFGNIRGKEIVWFLSPSHKHPREKCHSLLFRSGRSHTPWSVTCEGYIFLLRCVSFFLFNYALPHCATSLFFFSLLVCALNSLFFHFHLCFLVHYFSLSFFSILHSLFNYFFLLYFLILFHC